MRIPEHFFLAASQFPDQIAIFDDYGTMSFQELQKEIVDTTEILKKNGINQGMCVGVQGSNSRYFIISAYAVMECKAVVMPLSNQLSTNEVVEIIQITGLHAIIDDCTNPIPFQNSTSLEINFPFQNWRLTFNPATNLPGQFAPHVTDPALIRYTSGTTGTSKGVVLSHATIEARIVAANVALQLGPGDRVLWVLSMAYHFVVSIILYLHHGSSIIICNNFLSGSILELINKHQATFLYASPVHIRLLANDTGKIKMNSVKKVISTSTAISKAQCDAFYKRYNLPVAQAYGIIELGLPVINLYNSGEVPEAIGHTVKGFEAAILDDRYKELPNGSHGQLGLKGPGMFDAYLSPPQTSRELLVNDWFLTGDIASIDADNLIRVVGRQKSMINVAGNKVFPEEVETILNQHPSIQLSRVSGYQHPLLGESVQAELLVHAGIDKPELELIRKYCRERLSPHKVPQKIVFVQELPMTDSGKLLRR